MTRRWNISRLPRKSTNAEGSIDEVSFRDVAFSKREQSYYSTGPLVYATADKVQRVLFLGRVPWFAAEVVLASRSEPLIWRVGGEFILGLGLG